MYRFGHDISGFSYGAGLSRLMVHRVNLADSGTLGVDTRELVGSKSGIAILDSSTKSILLPPGSSVEVDFWVFGEERVVVTHNNPKLSRIGDYPTLEQYLAAWKIKRDAEIALGVRPGLIHANLKTHGGEEALIDRCVALGVPSDEIVLLDQEFPATDRLLREKRFGEVAPLALRISRVESLRSVQMALEQRHVFGLPRAVFLDPVGEAESETIWPVSKNEIEMMYRSAPGIEFILCCPSRWGKRERIPDVARRLQDAGVKAPIVMTDIDLFAQWKEILDGWR